MNDSVPIISSVESAKQSTSEDNFYPAKPTESWRHIPFTALVCGVFALIAAVIAGWHSGLVAVAGVLAGTGLVIASYTISAFIVGICDAISRSMLLPMGLATYVVKFATFGVILALLARQGWPGLFSMAVAIIATTALWSFTQLWWTVRDAQMNKK